MNTKYDQLDVTSSQKLVEMLTKIMPEEHLR